MVPSKSVSTPQRAAISRASDSLLAEGRDHPVVEPHHEHWRRAAKVTTAAWRVRGRRRRLPEAGIALALSSIPGAYLCVSADSATRTPVEVAARLNHESPARRSGA
jgi:hypothetical protein